MYQSPTELVPRAGDGRRRGSGSRSRPRAGSPRRARWGPPCEALRLGPEAAERRSRDVGTSVDARGDPDRDRRHRPGARRTCRIQVLQLDCAGAARRGPVRASTNRRRCCEVPRTNFWFAPIDPTAATAGRSPTCPSARRCRRSGARSGGLVVPLLDPGDHARDRPRPNRGRDRATGVHQLADRRRAAGIRCVCGRDRALRRRPRGPPAPRRRRIARRAAAVRRRRGVRARASRVRSSASSARRSQSACWPGARALPVDIVLGLALLQPAGIVLTSLLVGLAMVAIDARHPSRRRAGCSQPRVVIAAVLPAGLILAWQRISAGPVDPARLAAEATSPASVLLPGALGLSVILGSLVLLPPLLRWLARVTPPRAARHPAGHDLRGPRATPARRGDDAARVQRRRRRVRPGYCGDAPAGRRGPGGVRGRARPPSAGPRRRGPVRARSSCRSSRAGPVGCGRGVQPMIRLPGDDRDAADVHACRVRRHGDRAS